MTSRFHKILGWWLGASFAATGFAVSQTPQSASRVPKSEAASALSSNGVLDVTRVIEQAHGLSPGVFVRIARLDSTDGARQRRQ